MKLRDLLNLIKNVGINNDIKEVFIVGGIPRDKLLNLINPNELNDIDISTGDNKIHFLATELGIELRKKYNINIKKADDGHTSIIFPGNKFKLDCSSNFITPDIDKILLKKGIKNPTDMQKEMFSRDFTVNSLTLSLDLKKIKDPTNLGLIDIDKKILKTCLNPDITLKVNTNRIIRAVYLSSKLDFDVDPKIIEWISKNKNLVRLSSDQYLIKNLDKAMNKNPDRAVYLINKADLWDVIPIVDKLHPYYAKRSPTKMAQLRKNHDYDYSEGIFMNLDKYKSVSDFRKKRRKKRMKEIKKIKDMKLK